MKKEIRLYIEGDTKAKGKSNDIALREGFHHFFNELIENARSKNIKFRIVMCGSKFITFKDYLTALKSHQDSFNHFILDADDFVDDRDTAKSFLEKQNPGWHWKDVAEDHCFLMVQVMESWFFADIDALEKFYGKNFNQKSLKQNNNVEKIAKSEVENGLSKATKNTQKGEYHKTKHGPKILEIISPQKIRSAAPNCKRIFEIIESEIK